MQLLAKFKKNSVNGVQGHLKYSKIIGLGLSTSCLRFQEKVALKNVSLSSFIWSAEKEIKKEDF